MTLSSWLRDYLYIPLGGDRKGRARTYANVMLTMAIGGMWHGGDSWNFLLWGLIHGTAISVARAADERGVRIPPWAGRALTLLVVMLAWTVFRAEGFHAAVAVLSGQAGLNGFAMSHEVALAMRPLFWATLVAGIVVAAWPALPKTREAAAGLPRAAWVAAWPLLAFAWSVVVLTGQQTIPFLYFQF
jgi:alginate O-acetyltransferase complex protein AlgI